MRYLHKNRYVELATLWTVAHQVPLSLGIPRQEYWSGLVAMPPSRRSSQPRDLTKVYYTAARFFTPWDTLGPVVKNLPVNAGNIKDEASVLESGRYPAEGNGNPLQYSYLENLMGRGAWWATVRRISKNQTLLMQLSKQLCRTISVQFSHSVMSDSLQPHGLQDTRLPCPSPTPGVCSNLCPLNHWCHPTMSSSVIPFSQLQSFPASGSFPMSKLFASGGQSIEVSASASVLLVNIQDWFPFGLTGLISLQSKGLSRFLQHHSSKLLN